MDSTVLAETEQFIARQREALLNQRQEILNKQKELDAELEKVDQMLTKFDVFEGKTASRRSTGTTRRSSGPRGSRREEILSIIREAGGLTRGEILEKMGLKGNKSGEMSVSNALTALTKGNQVRRDQNRKYVAA